MASPLIEGIGIAAGIIGVVAWGPQIVEVWKHNGMMDFNPYFFYCRILIIAMVNLRYRDKVNGDDFCKYTDIECYRTDNYRCCKNP